MSAEALIRSMFDGQVAVSVATASMYVQGLRSEEAAAMHRAAPRRLRDFTAGRNCARSALRELGAPEAAILNDAAGVPRWPEGFVGSITHCDGFCAAVVGHAAQFAGLGLDAEPAAPLSDDLAVWIARPGEINCSHPPGAEAKWLNVAFGAKEAVYKAYYPGYRNFLDFLDVELDLSMNNAVENLNVGSFSARLANQGKRPLSAGLSLGGRWAISDGFVLCVATLRTS